MIARFERWSRSWESCSTRVSWCETSTPERPTWASLAQSSNALVLTYTGISNIDTNATVRIYVYPLETQALFVTD